VSPLPSKPTAPDPTNREGLFRTKERLQLLGLLDEARRECEACGSTLRLALQRSRSKSTCRARRRVFLLLLSALSEVEVAAVTGFDRASVNHAARQAVAGREAYPNFVSAAARPLPPPVPFRDSTRRAQHLAASAILKRARELAAASTALARDVEGLLAALLAAESRDGPEASSPPTPQ
jgi:hypothetical protein